MTDRRALMERLNVAITDLQAAADDWEGVVNLPTLRSAQMAVIDLLRDAAALISGTCATCKQHLANGDNPYRDWCGLGVRPPMLSMMPVSRLKVTFACNQWTPADPTPRTER